MYPAEFEPTIPANERLQTQALDRAVAGIGPQIYFLYKIRILSHSLLAYSCQHEVVWGPVSRLTILCVYHVVIRISGMLKLSRFGSI
jgi:hypothetical protein